MNYKFENGISGPTIVFNDELKKETYIKELQEENKKLKSNWECLKLFLLNGLTSQNYIINEHCMLNKMYELEKSNK